MVKNYRVYLLEFTSELLLPSVCYRTLRYKYIVSLTGHGSDQRQVPGNRGKLFYLDLTLFYRKKYLYIKMLKKLEKHLYFIKSLNYVIV